LRISWFILARYRLRAAGLVKGAQAGAVSVSIPLAVYAGVEKLNVYGFAVVANKALSVNGHFDIASYLDFAVIAFHGLSPGYGQLYASL
jgi:hypothetical protein